MTNIPDYPVTTPYGQVPGYPLNNGFHNGIDYGCPVATPVVVNGVTIGLSGNTGYSSGPHCHVGRWVNGSSTDPGVGNGFNFHNAVVTECKEDATNGKYVRVYGDGASWVYLHMSDNSKVSVGKVLQGDDMTIDDALARRLYTLSTLMAQSGDAPDRQPTVKEIEDAVGRDAVAFCDYLTSTGPWGANWNKVKHYDEDVAAGSGVTPYNGPQLYTKK